LKIALVTGNYWPRVGGAEAHVRALASELAKSNEVAVVTLDNPSHQLVLEKETNVNTCRASRGFSFREIVALPSRKGASEFHSALEEFDPDIVCTFTRFYLTTPMAQRWARKRGIPHVHSELGGGHVQTSSSLINFFSYIYDQVIGKKILQKSNAVIALSREAAAFIREWAKVDSSVVGNGIDLKFWTQTETSQVVLKPSNTKREYLFVGRLVPEKGLPTLLDALRVLTPKERTNLILNIVAPAEQIENMNFLKQCSDITDSLRIFPSPSREKIRELYERSVYLNPSTAGEGFQTTLLESSACGSYTYTNSVGGAAAMVPNESFGKIFFDDSIQNWIDVFKASPISGSVRIDTSSIVNNFGWAEVAKRYHSVFRREVNFNNQT
jgi:glycosyltransferase involved in cell wall biosynthesis